VSDYAVEDAGQVILVECMNITVKNLNLSSTDVGVQLWRTNNTKIVDNNITNNWWGIRLFYSSNNSIIGNNITNNLRISLDDSSNNSIFHNNFVNNTIWDWHASVNVWDDGYPSGGNYWSNYKGVDLYSGPYQNETGSDGIGDVPSAILTDFDRFPLIAPISIFDVGAWNETYYSIEVVSNSTVTDTYFNPEEGTFLRFKVTGEDGTAGFCRVTIPKALLWVEDGWTILVDGRQITNFTIIPDNSFTYLYFTYNHSTKTVIIQGTHAIPEFPSTMILPLLMLTILIVTILQKKRRELKPQLP
jgi:parallel beta-helix repeat protein